MLWEMYDTASRNALGDFDSEDEALAWVWAVIREEGLVAVLDLALGVLPGGPEETVFGLALAERAFRWTASSVEREHALTAAPGP
jgi:hypothetical protein